MNGKHQLTPKQENFCLKYLECGNASQAYRYAYPASIKWIEKSVWEKASVLLNHVKVKSRIRELQDLAVKKSEITKERVLEEFAKIGFSSIAALHNTWIDRKQFEALTDQQKAAIKSISTRTKQIVLDKESVEIEEIKIELYDKLRALEAINKMLGFDAPIKQELTGKGGAPLQLTVEVIDKTEQVDEITDQ